MNRIKQPKPVFRSSEALDNLFFNDRLHICFKTVRRLLFLYEI